MSSSGTLSETAGAASITRYCQTCRLTGEGSPPGWLRVTVNDPDTPRGYRVFGVFCGTECLAAKLPEVAQLLAQIDQLRAAQASVEPVEPEADVSARCQPVVNDVARELLALGEIVERLEALPDAGRQRCARYLADRYRTPDGA